MSITELAKDGTEFIASYSIKVYAQTEAKIHIARTTFILITLSLASIFFTKDA